MRWSVQKTRVFMISKPLFSTRRDKSRHLDKDGIRRLQTQHLRDVGYLEPHWEELPPEMAAR